jgi:hypothetical protein
MDVRDPTAERSGRPVLSEAAPLNLAARSHWRRGERPRQGSRDLGKDSGAFRATWRTRPWAQRRRGGTRGRITRQGGPTARGSTSASNRAKTRAINREIGAWGGCSPREETLEHRSNGGDTWTPRVDGGGALTARGELR